jgi:hypothetical protein
MPSLVGSVVGLGGFVKSALTACSDVMAFLIRIGALAMLPVILWRGWETLGEAREHDDEHEDRQ